MQGAIVWIPLSGRRRCRPTQRRSEREVKLSKAKLETVERVHTNVPSVKCSKKVDLLALCFIVEIMTLELCWTSSLRPTSTSGGCSGLVLTVHLLPGTLLPDSRVDQTNWGETQKIIEAIHKMPLEGVGSRRDADQV